jgi:hypothetical protein
MVGPAIPFVGLAAQSFASATQKPEDLFGPPVGAIFGKYAIGEAPAGSPGFGFPVLARAIWKVFGWRLSGQTWPHSFVDRATGTLPYPVTTLSPEERDALRPLCGPHPVGSKN